jgi:hypothetical protein
MTADVSGSFATFFRLATLPFGGAFTDYVVKYMFWSPVVHHSQGKPEYDQFALK